MNNDICQQIENSAHYRELVEKRQRFAFILSIIMLSYLRRLYSADRLCAALAGHPAACGYQRHARYSDWDWRDRHFVCADRRVRLACER